MKKEILVACVALLMVFLAVGACATVGRGMAGSVYEKVSIFSLIALTIFAIVFIPFAASWEDKLLVRYMELIRSAPGLPIEAAEVTGHPVYVWDSPSSFLKMVFHEDGALSVSDIVTTNSIDPKGVNSGTWARSPQGTLLLSLTATVCTRDYTCISRFGYNIPALIRLPSGHAVAWFLGADALRLAQISCFGYSGSLRTPLKFTANDVAGRTVYWGTYPCILPISGDEISVNPELTYGAVTFREDGTLTKSVSNAFDASPNYADAFTGTWKIDGAFGVLRVSIGYRLTQYNLLHRSAGPESLIVGSATGNEQWFVSRERGAEDLASYLAQGVHLDGEKKGLFLPPAPPAGEPAPPSALSA